MKYFRLIIEENPSKTKVKLINNNYKYLNDLYENNLLNENIIKSNIEFSKRINKKSDYIAINGNNYTFPLYNLISENLYFQMKDVLNVNNCIKINVNKLQTVYLLV